MRAFIRRPADQGDGKLVSPMISDWIQGPFIDNREGEGTFSGLTNGRRGPVNWLLGNSCSRAWEKGPTRLPDQRLSRPVIAGVCLNEVCVGSQGGKIL